jgi:S-adenosyl methyltransferase
LTGAWVGQGTVSGVVSSGGVVISLVGVQEAPLPEAPWRNVMTVVADLAGAKVTVAGVALVRGRSADDPQLAQTPELTDMSTSDLHPATTSHRNVAMTHPDDELQPDVPHAARIWNYWMGGKDNFAADRAAGDAVAQVYPEIVVMAQQSRRFLSRVVRYLAAEAGVRQFLDIGTGLPTMQNTHAVAQQIAPEARIVYVDNDPMVLAHARALLVGTTDEGATTYVHADYHEPEKILAEAGKTLDFKEPVAVMFMGVMGYEPDLDRVRSIVGTMMDTAVSGSYLVLWDGTDTTPAVVEGAQKLADSGGVPYILRSPEELASCFADLTMVDPGLTQITEWRPDDADVEPIEAYGAVARKP